MDPGVTDDFSRTIPQPITAYSTLTMKALSWHHDVYPEIDGSHFVDAFRDTTVLVTGARGIGRAIVNAFARSGARMAIVARTQRELEELAQECEQKYGTKCCICVADQTDQNAIELAVAMVQRELGPIDVLVNNAAVLRLKPFVLGSMDDWWKVIEINLKGVCEK